MQSYNNIYPVSNWGVLGLSPYSSFFNYISQNFENFSILYYQEIEYNNEEILTSKLNFNTKVILNPNFDKNISLKYDIPKD